MTHLARKKYRRRFGLMKKKGSWTRENRKKLHMSRLVMPADAGRWFLNSKKGVSAHPTLRGFSNAYGILR